MSEQTQSEQSEESQPTVIETDLFIFASPPGYSIDELGEDAELIGPQNQFLSVASYNIDVLSDESLVEEFHSNIANAMTEAANESDLYINQALHKEIAPNGLPVYSLLAETDDRDYFFDQYAIAHGAIAVLVTIEGEHEHRGDSALIEESVYCVEFKS